MSDHAWKIIISLLVLTGVTLWMAVLYFPDNDLRVITCNVGQGDAILIIQGKSQLLIDGGPDNSVIDCLDEYLPFWDRQIETVILTHPDKDHFLELIDVFKKYRVNQFITSELDPGIPEFGALEELVGGSSTLVIRPRRGMSIRLGLIYLDILHPSELFLQTNFDEEHIQVINYPQLANEIGIRSTSKNDNDFSIVFHLRYQKFDALITGDIGPEVMDEVLQTDIRDVEYLQVPHHGSKNGLSIELLERSSPEIAVISAGKNNPHGHPHQEVLDLLNGEGVRYFRTDERGDVIIRTDGEKVYVKKSR